MRTTLLITSLWAATAALTSAQTPAMPADVTPSILRLTVDDAVKMALDHNIDLSAERLDPQISDTRVAAAVGAFRPTFSSGVQRNNQLHAHKFPRANGHAHRRRHLEHGVEPEAAVVRHVLQRVVECRAHRQQQLPQ